MGDMLTGGLICASHTSGESTSNQMASLDRIKLIREQCFNKDILVFLKAQSLTEVVQTFALGHFQRNVVWSLYFC